MPAKKHGLRKLLRDCDGELRDFFHGVVADGGVGFGVETSSANENSITLRFSRDVAAKIFDFVRAFEIARIHHTSLDEHKTSEHARKHFQHG